MCKAHNLIQWVSEVPRNCVINMCCQSVLPLLVGGDIGGMVEGLREIYGVNESNFVTQ